MSRTVASLGVISLLLNAISGPVWANSTQAPAAKQADADPNEKVCRTIGKTGSRLGGQRICRTRAEWELVSRAGSKQARDMTERHTQLPDPNR